MKRKRTAMLTLDSKKAAETKKAALVWKNKGSHSDLTEADEFGQYQIFSQHDRRWQCVYHTRELGRPGNVVDTLVIEDTKPEARKACQAHRDSIVLISAVATKRRREGVVEAQDASEPLGTIGRVRVLRDITESKVVVAGHDLAKWKKKFEGGPSYAFFWGSSAFQAAAEMEVNSTVLKALDAHGDIAAVRDRAFQEVQQIAADPPRHSMQSANIMTQALGASWADVVKRIDSLSGREPR